MAELDLRTQYRRERRLMAVGFGVLMTLFLAALIFGKGSAFTDAQENGREWAYWELPLLAVALLGLVASAPAGLRSWLSKDPLFQASSEVRAQWLALPTILALSVLALLHYLLTPDPGLPREIFLIFAIGLPWQWFGAVRRARAWQAWELSQLVVGPSGGNGTPPGPQPRDG